jgi:hypothetical protein
MFCNKSNRCEYVQRPIRGAESFVPGFISSCDISMSSRRGVFKDSLHLADRGKLLSKPFNNHMTHHPSERYDMGHKKLQFFIRGIVIARFCRSYDRHLTFWWPAGPVVLLFLSLKFSIVPRRPTKSRIILAWPQNISRGHAKVDQDFLVGSKSCLNPRSIESWRGGHLSARCQSVHQNSLKS